MRFPLWLRASSGPLCLPSVDSTGLSNTSDPLVQARFSLHTQGLQKPRENQHCLLRPPDCCPHSCTCQKCPSSANAPSSVLQGHDGASTFIHPLWPLPAYRPFAFLGKLDEAPLGSKNRGRPSSVHRSHPLSVLKATVPSILPPPPTLEDPLISPQTYCYFSHFKRGGEKPQNNLLTPSSYIPLLSASFFTKTV